MASRMRRIRHTVKTHRLMASKSTSSNSPSPLRASANSPSADPGCAIRPMIDPTATAKGCVGR